MPTFGQPFSNNLKQRLGQLLVDSALISDAKLHVALYEQKLFNLRLGEILAAHGWIEPQTATFFAEQWYLVKIQDVRYPLGQYLKAAGLLSESQISQILRYQKNNGDRFGNSAIRLGFILPQTIDYFLEHLFPECLEPTLVTSECATVVQTFDHELRGRHLYN